MIEDVLEDVLRILQGGNPVSDKGQKPLLFFLIDPA
jgi:hypothetical protein